MAASTAVWRCLTAPGGRGAGPRSARRITFGLIGRHSPGPLSTVVEIALIPTLDNREQKWTVVSIERRFPGSNSGKQFEEIRAQLDARYGAFSYKKQMGRRQKDGEAQYVGDGYGFTLKTLWPDLTERLRLHPACGGTAKVNID